jgi:hypothetical protein
VRTHTRSPCGQRTPSASRGSEAKRSASFPVRARAVASVCARAGASASELWSKP